MTRLMFEAPRDLSIGRVRISGVDGLVKDWLATPDQRRQILDEVKPGFYTAEISPIGMRPQSVVFQVGPGAENQVSVPAFSWLQANAGNVTFLDIDDRVRAIEGLFPSPPDKTKHKPPHRAAKSRETTPSSSWSSPLPRVRSDFLSSAPSGGDRRLSVGLSIEGEEKSQPFTPFAGGALLDLADGRLQLTVGAGLVEPTEPRRVRLSVAIERNRTQFLYLPIYRGGVVVTLKPSPLSPLDVDVEVTPRNPSKRALVRILLGGTAEDAAAVCSVPTHLPAIETAMVQDPFEALLLALLSARFPGTLPPPSERLAKRLTEAAPWSQDAYILAARQKLYGADPGADRAAAAIEALDLLRRARRLRRPYFAYANRIFAELMEALVGYFDDHGPSHTRRAASKLHRQWRREQTLHANAGTSFSWLKRDAEALQAGFLAPDRTVSGRLASRFNNVIFSGRLTAGRVQMERLAPGLPSDASETSDGAQVNYVEGPADAPAMGRPPGPEDDPNLGRFGGRAVSGGYRLEAHFNADPDPDWVAIYLSVINDTSSSAPGSVAWFCLHPTFEPQWVRVMLVNGRADLDVDSWGGFTVGVWLPHVGVELELDLAGHPDAPEIVRSF